jgi:hypothetical protein
MAARRGGMAKLVRILCAIALLCLGFAHKPPTADAASISIAEFEQYVLPDGTLSVLCLSDMDGQSHGDKNVGNGCEACRLSASILLPAPGDASSWLIPRSADRFIKQKVETVVWRHLTACASPRGPPSGLIV